MVYGYCTQLLLVHTDMSYKVQASKGSLLARLAMHVEPYFSRLQAHSGQVLGLGGQPAWRYPPLRRGQSTPPRPHQPNMAKLRQCRSRSNIGMYVHTVRTYIQVPSTLVGHSQTAVPGRRVPLLLLCAERKYQADEC